MGGLGMILGGVLEGVGKGLATQGAMEYEARKKQALEQLRAQNDRANADYEHDLKTELEGTKHQNTLAEQLNQYDLMDRNADRNTQRSTNAHITKTKAESDVQEARERRLAEFNSNLRMKEAAQKAGIEASQVADVVTDGETGAVSIVTKGGESRILPNIIARPKPGATAGGGANDWRSALGDDGEPKPAPSATRTQPAQKPQAPKVKGAVEFDNDAAIEAFMRHGANKGKPFVDARDGKTYWVPYR